jgi:nucleotide-binding universal stress UspA family protein
VISLSPFSSTSPTLAWQAIAAQAVHEAKEAVASLEPQLKAIPHEVIIRKGDIWQELSAIVDQEAIELVVVGTHGRTGVSKVLMGSVAERIFRQAPCPVLTVGPNVSGEPEAIVDMHTILFPTDFSPESVAAVPYAISLAQEHQARVYLLHVTSGAVDDVPEVSVKTALHNLIPPQTEFLCEPRMFIESGEPAQKILELAEELAVDLIVLGVKPTPRLPGASHLAMATAYRVVTGAICPVLTVRGQR